MLLNLIYRFLKVDKEIIQNHPQPLTVKYRCTTGVPVLFKALEHVVETCSGIVLYWVGGEKNGREKSARCTVQNPDTLEPSRGACNFYAQTAVKPEA